MQKKSNFCHIWYEIPQNYVKNLNLKLTNVVTRGHGLSDADGGGADRDDEHLVVTLDVNKARM